MAKQVLAVFAIMVTIWGSSTASVPGNCQATIQTNNNDGSSPPSYSQFTWYAQEYNEPKTWQFTFYVQAGHSAYVKLAEYTELSSRQPAFEIALGVGEGNRHLGYRCEDKEWQYLERSSISANEKRGFQVKYSWHMHMLQLYRVGENSPMMIWPTTGSYHCLSWSQPEPYLGVASGAGSSAEWNVCGDNVVGLGDLKREVQSNLLLKRLILDLLEEEEETQLD